jgi:hypothetical protein
MLEEPVKIHVKRVTREERGVMLLRRSGSEWEALHR